MKKLLLAVIAIAFIASTNGCIFGCGAAPLDNDAAVGTDSNANADTATDAAPASDAAPDAQLQTH